MHITQDNGSRSHRNTAYRIHKFLYPAETMHTVRHTDILHIDRIVLEKV